MINIEIYKQSNYPVSAIKIKKELKRFFAEKGISSDAHVSIALVGETKMKQLGERFIKPGEPIHNVLSFTGSEVKKDFVEIANRSLDLGEIVVCYPVAFREAKKENKMIDEKIFELLFHGADHLLGIHHQTS